uniref:Rubicon like autophagy enhancer n=1 Tax=Lepisosteus oculatus TaxID=7918 RepID=W5MWV1_LEPOC
MLAVLCKDTATVSREPSHVALSPDDISRTSCDLDKENAHFIIVDMVLEALESTKCALWSQRAGQAGRGQLGCPVGLPEEETGSGPLSKRHSESVASSDSGYEGRTLEKQNPDADTGTTSSLQRLGYCCDTPVVKQLSDSKDLPHVICDRSCSNSSFVPVSPCSAENLATQLLRIFRKQWIHSESQRHGLGNLSSVLQEFPVDVMDVEHSLTLAEEIKQKARMRGTLIWAPPRFQIIFNIHPPQKRSTVVASQHYLCAGCGTQVEPKYIKKLRYCEYLGKYFCDCCHNDSESVIPGHILMKWDFSKYLVCNFSKHLLYSIWHNPLFNVSCINKTLYAKAKELDRFRELQEQLLAMKKLLVTCRLSECVLQEFSQLPEHLTRELHLFSLDDLVRVKRGLLPAQARALLRVASAHVETCELCLAKGFICEFCKGKDVLFPFQKETCKRCEDCKACFHKDCFKEEECPKCLRIQARKKLKDAFSLDVL